MSHSTTATTAYTLAKYSRSYSQPTGPSQTGAEWQHFVNPVIRLLLDIRKSSTGDLESFRMRILWSLDATGPEAMDTDQREVVFEDLELLAFSSLPPLQERATVPQGLPLKAVYRDCVVGVRYLHPRVVPAGATPMYRRFQITFQSASWASGFIDMIRFVCPCKANPPPPRIIPQAVPATHPVKKVQPQPAYTEAEAFGRLNLAANSAGTPLRPTATVTSAWDRTERDYRLPQILTAAQTTSQTTHRPLDHTVPHAPFDNTASSQAPVNYLSASGLFAQPRTTPDPSDEARPSSAVTASSAMGDYHSSDAPYPQSQSQAETSVDQRSRFSRAPSVPHTTRPASPLSSAPAPQTPHAAYPGTGSSMAPPPVPPSSRELEPLQVPSQPASSAGLDKQDFLASLEETPSLYGLPRTDLERLVAKIVREDGFTKLLEDIDSMWMIRGFLGRN